MRAINKALSVILSICILVGAAAFVSAEITGGNVTVLPGSAPSKTGGTTDGQQTALSAENRDLTVTSTSDTVSAITKTDADTDSAGENTSDTSVGKNQTKNSAENAPGINSDIPAQSPMPISSGSENTSPEPTPVRAYSRDINAEFNGEDASEPFKHTYSDSFFSSADSASYILTAKTRGAIVCEIKHEKLSAGAYKMCLYMKYSPNGDGKSEAWRLINELETTAAGGMFKSAEIGAAAGTYKAVVTCLNRNVPDREYIASFVFIEGTGYEIEYNDTVTRYNEIAAGQTVKGSASYFSDGKDCDWYMFRSYGNCAISFTFDHKKKDLPTVCWKIWVYDSDGNEIYSDNSYFSTESLRSGKIGVKKGCYFIKIENRVYSDETYSLKLYKYNDLPYESEINDLQAYANEIIPGTAVTGELSSRSSGSDIDWYKFVLGENGVCSFTFSHEPDASEIQNVLNGSTPKNGWRITVISNGNAVYSGVSSWDVSTVISPEIGLGAGTYYVKIDSADLYRNKTPYTLNVSFDASSSSWEQEPNGTFETADTLISGNSKYGTISSFENGDRDDDYYVFTVTQRSRVSVSLEHDAVPYSEKNIFIFGLYDSSRSRVALSDEKGLPLLTSGSRPVYSISSFSDGKPVYAYAALEPGTYYVKVTPGLQYESMRYKLTLMTTEVTQ